MFSFNIKIKSYIFLSICMIIVCMVFRLGIPFVIRYFAPTQPPSFKLSPVDFHDAIVYSPAPLFLGLGRYDNTSSAYDIEYKNSRFERIHRYEEYNYTKGPIVHFVLLSEKDGNIRPSPFGHGMLSVSHMTFYRYLAIKAAYTRLGPVAIYLHCDRMPEVTPYWTLSRPMISKVVLWRHTNTIFGKQVKYQEHKADLLRLRALYKYGGIYLDLDIVAMRSLDSYFNMVHQTNKTTVVGIEHKGALNNSVIISRRRSPFVKRWIDGYKWGYKDNWTWNSVVYPWQLKEESPDSIHAVATPIFFDPPYLIEKGFFGEINETNPEFHFNSSKTLHLWNTPFKQNVLGSTAFDILYVNNNVNRVLRPLLPNPLFSLITSKAAIVRNQSFPLYEIVSSADNAKGVWHVVGGDGDVFETDYLLQVLRLINASKDYNHTIYTQSPNKTVNFVYASRWSGFSVDRMP